MPRQVIVWECEYCKKKRNFSKTWIEKHEASCMANPDGKNCYKCKHFEDGLGCIAVLGQKNSYTALTCGFYEAR